MLTANRTAFLFFAYRYVPSSNAIVLQLEPPLFNQEI
jgi:hypothetical protein